MNIAIIENSNLISHLIYSTLSSYGYPVKLFQKSEINIQTISPKSFQLFVINTCLDKIDTPHLVRRIRLENPDLYILGIHSKGNWQEKVGFLNAGGDDVLAYPFPTQELLARIQALLRRPKKSFATKYKVEDITIDPIGKTVKVQKQKLDLRRRQFALLEYMVRNKNRPISRAELMDHVWDYRRITDSNTVDVHVSSLRRALKKPNLIKTVHGFGYVLSDKQEKSEKKESSREIEEIPQL